MIGGIWFSVFCSVEGCSRRFDVSLVETCRARASHGTFFDTALSLGRDAGWKFVGNCLELPNWNVAPFCVEHHDQAAAAIQQQPGD